MNLADVTPLILTFNEAANIGRVLERLRWASRIVVIDSGSDDGTLEIVRQHAQVEVFVRPFDSHTKQWNFALGKVTSPFTLSLDADYVITPEFESELRGLDAAAADAWSVPFTYWVHGRPLRGTVLPPRLALFRTAGARFVEDGHTQKLAPPARVAVMKSRIGHDDRKPLGRWLDAQRRYAVLEARKLSTAARRDLSWPDRLRCWYLGPALVVPYCLFAKGLIFDGRIGWFYTAQRTHAELLIALELFELRRQPTPG